MYFCTRGKGRGSVKVGDRGTFRVRGKGSGRVRVSFAM